jgi:hypothetical protein
MRVSIASAALHIRVGNHDIRVHAHRLRQRQWPGPKARCFGLGDREPEPRNDCSVDAAPAR